MADGQKLTIKEAARGPLEYNEYMDHIQSIKMLRLDCISKCKKTTFEKDEILMGIKKRGTQTCGTRLSANVS